MKIAEIIRNAEYQGISDVNFYEWKDGIVFKDYETCQEYAQQNNIKITDEELAYFYIEPEVFISGEFAIISSNEVDFFVILELTEDKGVYRIVHILTKDLMDFEILANKIIRE